MNAPRRAVVALVVAAGALAGCAGTTVSARPIYPADWAAAAPLEPGRTCPDLSGTYRAVSDEAPPLVYPPGGYPREMMLLVPYGPSQPAPRLGRRLLMWHLSGTFGTKGDDADSAALTRYAAALDADSARPDRRDDDAWVRVAEQPDGVLDLRAGLRERELVRVEIRPGSAGVWTLDSHVYQCDDGRLVVSGGFPPPPVENPFGAPGAVGAKCTFFRATDGSLVMLEEPYTGVQGGTMLFRKWWRWRPVAAAGR